MKIIFFITLIFSHFFLEYICWGTNIVWGRVSIRVADPGWYYPDPFIEKRLVSDSTPKKNRIRVDWIKCDPGYPWSSPSPRPLRYQPPPPAQTITDPHPSRSLAYNHSRVWWLRQRQGGGVGWRRCRRRRGGASTDRKRTDKKISVFRGIQQKIVTYQ